MNSPEAEILTIGTELLLGEITDTNTGEIARALREVGINLFRTATVGDNAGRIAQLIGERCGACQILISTGGLGPTVDDPTREAVAQATGVELEFRPELWEQIRERFAGFGVKPSDNNRRQAYLPAGATAIENPVGTAPAFWVECRGTLVFSLPGVPAEMAYLLEHAVIPLIRTKFGLPEVIRARVVRTAGLGESRLDVLIDDLERLSNPTVGVSAHPGRVDIRITARAATLKATEALLEPVVADVTRRLSDHIYGFDKETLEGALLDAAAAHSWAVSSLEAGTDGRLAAGLSAAGRQNYVRGVVLPNASPNAAFEADITDLAARPGLDVILGLHFQPGENDRQARAILKMGGLSEEKIFRQRGSSVNSAERAASLALDWARRSLLPSAGTD